MLGDYFYHESLRKIIIAFGTIFNNIHIHRKDSNGNVVQSLKVPLAYSPKEKFIARLDQQPDLVEDRRVAVTLPRMGFEIKNLSYDSARKLNRVQRFKTVKGSETKQLDTQYMPVPYNLDIELYVMAKQSDDALQIVEQILPYFQPDYTITVADLGGGTKRDVPVVLNSITYEDNYEGEFEQRRALIYTLAFTAKFYLYGPVSSSKVIKTVSVDQYTDMPDKSPRREQRYTVTPNPSTADADDNFGFNETTSFFQDAQEYDEKTGDDEEN